MKNLWNRYRALLFIAGAVLALDQITKTMVRSTLAIGEYWSPWDWLTPYARIFHVSNNGISFGLFQGIGPYMVVVYGIVVLAILYYYPRLSEPSDWPLRLALALQMGGTLGNMVDRLTVGHVTDFLSVGNFAICNFADYSISLGVGVMILTVFIQEKRRKDHENSTAEAERLR